MKCARNENNPNYNYTLYYAMRKYGIDNFKVEEVEKCEIEKLDEREIYWIKHYNSYHDGYNSTIGGSGAKTLELNEEEVIIKYQELQLLSAVATYFDCSSNSIHNILIKNDIEIKSAVDIAKEKGFKTYALDNDKNIIKAFNTLFEAGEWVFNNCKHNAKNANSCKIGVLYAILKGHKSYGYFWQSDEYDDVYIKEWRKNNINNHNVHAKKKLIQKDICPICKKNLKLETSIRCVDCGAKSTVEKKKEKFLNRLETKISKEELMKLVRTKSFLEISKLYFVSDNTVRKWCKNYCIPFRKEDINNISNIDWESECNLSKEDYEAKYINTKKVKPIITDQEIIDKYLKVKNLTKVGEFFHKDNRTIKKILKDNGIELFDVNLEKSKSLGKVQRLDKKTNEVLQTYDCLVDAIDWLCKYYNREDNRPNYKKNVCKAVNHNLVAFGFKWKRINEGD